MKTRLGIFFLLVVLSSCDPLRVYEQHEDFPNRYWLFDNVPSFEIDIADTAQSYDVLYAIRNTNNYNYTNLYLTYYVEDSLNRLIASGLHNMHLFDAETGKSFGKGLGDIHEHSILGLKNYKFQYPGKYFVKLQQFMRTDTLHELVSIGVRLEKSSAN